MATVVIQKRKRNKRTSYLIHYKDPVTYKSVYYKTCHKYKDAHRAAQTLRDLIDNGRFSEIKRKKKKIQPLKFEVVADAKEADWIKDLKKNELSEKTFDDYTGRLVVLKRIFGSRLLIEISQSDLFEHQQTLLENWSPASANRYLFIIKQVFKKGISLGACVDDPSAAVTYLSEEQHERSYYLMPDELEKLVGFCQMVRAKFYLPALIYLGAEHGAAKQEVLSLKWTDIIFDYRDKGLITLFRTKNKKRRTEFLMPRTRQALLDWKAHLEHARRRNKIEVLNTDTVFCRLNGTPIKRFDTAWNRVKELAGFPDFHFHDLRHTFCSNLIMAGSDLKEVKDMIGHKDLSMTDRYSHLSSLHKATLQDQLSDHYQNHGKTT
jgi:integrase